MGDSLAYFHDTKRSDRLDSSLYTMKPKPISIPERKEVRFPGVRFPRITLVELYAQERGVTSIEQFLNWRIPKRNESTRKTP